MADQTKEQKEIEALKAELATLKEEYESLGKDMATATARVHELEGQQAKDKASLAEAETKIEGLEKQVEAAKELEEQLNQVRGQVTQLSNSNEDLAKKLISARNAAKGDSIAILSGLLDGAKLIAPLVSVRGTDEKKPSDIRKFQRVLSPKGFLHIETLLFKNTSGYDDNWRKNLMSACERCLGGDFGGRDRSTGSLLFDQLPPFDPNNRAVLIAAILPPGDDTDESEG